MNKIIQDVHYAMRVEEESLVFFACNSATMVRNEHYGSLIVVAVTT